MARDGDGLGVKYNKRSKSGARDPTQRNSYEISGKGKARDPMVEDGGFSEDDLDDDDLLDDGEEMAVVGDGSASNFGGLHIKIHARRSPPDMGGAPRIDSQVATPKGEQKRVTEMVTEGLLVTGSHGQTTIDGEGGSLVKDSPADPHYDDFPSPPALGPLLERAIAGIWETGGAVLSDLVMEARPVVPTPPSMTMVGSFPTPGRRSLRRAATSDEDSLERAARMVAKRNLEDQDGVLSGNALDQILGASTKG
ncbi:unnamed protein product [Urochloa humidicola]